MLIVCATAGSRSVTVSLIWEVLGTTSESILLASDPTSRSSPSSVMTPFSRSPLVARSAYVSIRVEMAYVAA